jgi:GT2 family glycosyltransferase
MRKAKGNYFIILDSDCLLPPQYLQTVTTELIKNYVDCFGGPDAAHLSFTPLQKAINFTMTSFITTGGIRGGKKQIKNYQPRSFNMGISKTAFEASNGFGTIHPGEDPDLSIRLNKLGFRTQLITEAFVYHKRRISWSKFYKQVNKFGLVRPILNLWHPETERFIFWLPSIFSLGLLCSILLFGLGYKLPLLIYAIYFCIAFLVSLVATKSILIAMLSIVAILVQFFGYGFGFIKSTIMLKIFKKDPKQYFPNLFFSKK